MLTPNVILAAEASLSHNDVTLFSKLAANFEAAVTYLLSQNEVTGVSRTTLEVFQKSYASTAFRCRFPNCSRPSTGFPSSELRTKHEATHLRRVYCGVILCEWNRIGFKNKSALDAHTRKHHGEKSTFLIPPKVRRTSEDEDNDKENEGNDKENEENDKENEKKDKPKQAISRLWSREHLEKQGSRWHAVYNPDIEKALEVDRVLTRLLRDIICDMRFSPDGHHIAAATDCCAIIFDLHTGQQFAYLRHDSDDRRRNVFVRSICYSTSGRFLATGSEDKLVRVCSFIFPFLYSILKLIV